MGFIKIGNLHCIVILCRKKELDGLNDRESSIYIMNILNELGMEGRPTLAKCQAIKEQRENEQELQALRDNPILDTKLRGQKPSFPTHAKKESDDPFLRQLSAIADSD